MTLPAQRADTKPCPHCAETIQAAAHICPHCRSRVDGGDAKALLGGIVLLIAAIGAWQFFSQPHDEIAMTIIAMAGVSMLVIGIGALARLPKMLHRRRTR
jgi:hypothetical protein